MASVAFSNNLINLTSAMDEKDENFLIYFHFVVEKVDDMSNFMKVALKVSLIELISCVNVQSVTLFLSQAAQEKFPVPEAISVITREECCNMPKAELKENRNVFVFDEFNKENEAFNYICSLKTT